MPKALSLTLKILLPIILLLVALVVAAIFLVNPNQYKPALQQAVLSSTGYDLNIAGDITLNFRPYIGVNLNDVRLRNPAYPQELASISSVSLKVDLGQLIRGNLYIEEFSASDFHANWLTNADGNNIWQVADRESDPAPPPTSDTESTISAAFRQITISNARVDIQDVAAGYRYSVTNLNLSSSDSNLENRPFPLQADFALIDHSADKTYDLGIASTVVYDSEAGNAELTELTLNLTPLLLEGEVIVAGINDELVWNGKIQSNTVVLSELMEVLGLSEPQELALTAPSINTNPGQQFSFSLAFAGDNNQISVPELITTLGGNTINTEINVRMASAIAPMNVSYEVSTGPLDLTPFLGEEADAAAEVETIAAPTPDTTGVPTNSAAESPTTQIPKELLTSMNVLGTISIESLTAGNFQSGAINLFTTLEDGLLDIESQPIQTLGGQVSGTLRLNSATDDALMETSLLLQNINISDLARSIPQLETVQGKIDVENNYVAEGNTTQELLASLNGASRFAINDNAIDITLIKQIFTSIAALSPYGAIGQNWPDVIRFNSVGGFLQIPDGLEGQQELRLLMDNFDMLGTGAVDLSQNSFDYDLAFTLLGEPSAQTIPIDERYRDISWPINCAAAFDAEVSQYCRPDFTKVRELFVQMGSNALQNELQERLDEELEDRIPEELRDGARGLLRNIFDRDN